MDIPNKIFVVITASLIQSNYHTRFVQYMNGITQTIKVFKDIPNVQIVIVENTGITSSFLDSFDIPILYTNTNNEINTNNKGIKELVDVFKAIAHFKMKDEDFLIKVTGRYLIHDDSNFIQAIKNLSTTNYNVVLKYGGYNLSEIYREKFYSCITGIVGMRVKYVKTIEMPDEVTCVEWKWADATMPISYDEICILEHLGITQFIGHDNKVIS